MRKQKSRAALAQNTQGLLLLKMKSEKNNTAVTFISLCVPFLFLFLFFGSPEAAAASALGAGNGTGIAWMSVMTSWMLPVPLTTSAAVMVLGQASREKAGWWNRESGLWKTRDHPVVLHRTCARKKKRLAKKSRLT